MRQIRFVLMILATLLMAGLTANTVVAEMGKQIKEQKMVLNPGTAGRCDTSFVVQNIDGEPADLKVVLGSKVYINEMVNPGERLAYNLPGTISTAKFHGLEDVTHDDVAVIINLGPKAKLQVQCIDLPSNPTREMDPLKTFK